MPDGLATWKGSIMETIDWIAAGLTCVSIVGFCYLVFVFITELGDDA